jgi:hemoglobin
MAKSLFDYYGGFVKVRRIVSDLYDAILDSDSLAQYFDAVDMRSQIDHQTKFIAQLMGGPASYTDEALQRIHTPLHISSRDFDEMVALLKLALEDNGVEPAHVAEVSSQIYRRKHIIVDMSSKAGE